MERVYGNHYAYFAWLQQRDMKMYHIQLRILFVLGEVVTLVSAEISMTTHGCRDGETEMKV